MCAKVMMLFFPFRLALEEKAAIIARCSAEECDGIIEETLAEEVAIMAREIRDNELRRICKFIKRFEKLIISLNVYEGSPGANRSSIETFKEQMYAYTPGGETWWPCVVS